jgi:PAS domain S-box-containing protein
MERKPTYEELERKVEELEKKLGYESERIKVSGINIEWSSNQGMCTFENLPVAMMWIDTTLAGLMSGVQAMVGTERFGLALQSEGRKSVEEDWRVISQFSDFRDGFKAIANIAAVAGWGEWELISLDENKQRCTFQVKNGWEGRYQKSLGVDWGSGMLAGKMAGYSSKLFKTNCWAEQTRFIAKGDEFDEFVVKPSDRSVENEIENLLLTDEATRADMAVALEKLQKEILERKQAEEALQFSLDRFKIVMDSLDAAVYVSDMETYELLFLNKYAQVHWGDVVGQTCWKALQSGQTGPCAFCTNEKLVDDNGNPTGVYAWEFQNTADDEWYDCRDQAIQWADERIVRMEIATNITERKRQEETLREYEHIVSSTSDLISFIDRDYVYQAVNESYLKAHQKEYAEIIGQSVADLHGREVFNKVIKNELDRCLAGEEIRYQEWFDYPGIDRRFMDVIYTPYFDASGEASGVVVIIRDNTELKRGEEKLLEEMRFSDTVINSLPGIFFVFNSQGYLVRWNENHEKVLGLSSEEMTTFHILQFVYEEDRELVSQKMQEALQQGYATLDTHILTKRGDIIPYSMTGVSMNMGDEVYLVGTGIDITERKQAEEERRILEAQLQQAQKMESIGTLAGGIAHDFNNILSPIILYTEMVLEDLPGESPLRFNLKEVYNASIRAKDLVKQILTFSHQAEQEKIPLIINSIIKEALILLRASLPSTIEIRQNIKVEDGLVLADPTQIHQILINLCTNAAHSMRERGGVLEVSLVDVDLHLEDTDHTVDLVPGQYIKLTVSDTGHGIEPTIMDKIFDPYFTTQEKGKGTGLGLSVVHGIVNTHGGHISVYSEPDKGARFDVYLPLFDLSDIKAETVSTEKLTIGNEHILLVDDEKPIIDVVQQMLERLGYQVTVRTSSIEALEAFRASMDKFDLVITDLTMPNMTGDKLAEELMNIRPDIPIILCTGFSENMSKKRAESLGIKGFLMKPIVTSELAKLIRDVINKSR